MLRQRILTALILMPLVILAVLWLPHIWFTLAVTAILLLGAWEWTHIAGIESTSWRLNYVISISLLIAAVTWLLHTHQSWLLALLVIIVSGWIIALVSVIRINAIPILLTTVGKGRYSCLIKSICGYFILTGTFIGLIGIRQDHTDGPQLVLALLILIWVADSAAYFTGRAVGKHKLAVHISPGKSWEGVLGAIVAVAITAYIVGVIFDLTAIEQVRFQIVCLLSAAFSILGDLTESLFKRLAGVKDSGRILPGHGGVMDRIDSLTAAAPVFLLGLLVAGL